MNKLLTLRTINSTVCLLLVAFIALGSTGVSAQSAETGGYSEATLRKLGIYFVGQNLVGNCASNSSGPSVGGSVGTGAGKNIAFTGNNEDDIFNFFVAEGLPPEAAAAFIGNMNEESGLDPRALEPSTKGDSPINGRGFGLVQWAFDARQVPLKKLAESTNQPVNSMKLQLEFVMQELGTPSYRKVYDRLKNLGGEDLKGESQVDKATEIIEIYYERHEGIHVGQAETQPPQTFHQARKTKANDVLNKHKSGAGGSGTGTCSGNSQIVAVAQAELAKNVKEIPAGIDSNSSPDINKYTDGHPEKWCADFVSWVYKEAGKPFTGGASGGWRLNAVGDLVSWLKSNGTYTTKQDNSFAPQPGDVVIIDDGGNPEGHTGIIAEVNGKSITTIEGNALDSVLKLTYDDYTTDAKVTGWGRQK
jgi:hypothetical protein